MGAWGHQSFDNDIAMDWVRELEERGIAAIRDSVIEQRGGYLEADICCEALAAADTVAAVNGKPSAALPEEVLTWVGAQLRLPRELSLLSYSAIAVIREDSELKELWEETDEFGAWLAQLDDLQVRLTDEKGTMS